MLLLCALIVGSGTMWADPITLFHETFGNNTGSARAWSDTYSVKSGVSAVYSGITGYTVSNVKQGKNTTGSTQSGLNQSTEGTDAYIIIGPLNVSSYNTLSLTYQWKAASTKGAYSTAAYYATSAQAANGTWTEVSGTGTGATTFVTRSYSLPAAAQVSTLYLKIVWNTSNTQAIIDEVNLSGIAAAPTTYTVTYAANGGSGTMTDSNSPYEAGDEVTLLSNTFTAPSGKLWSSWAVTDGSSNTVTVTDGKFTMPSSNVTVTAQWADVPASDYITVSPTTINVAAGGGNPEFTISTDQTLDDEPTQFYTTADGDVTASMPTWIEYAQYMEGTLFVSVKANTGAARTAYFRVEKGSVKSSVITINQDAKTYEIDQYTAPATAHGTITFSPESPVDAGAEVTLTATPASGYNFTADSWVFYKESAGDFVVDESISVTDNQFTMPAYAIYVDGTFTAIAVTGVTLNKTTASIGVGETETLTATISPTNALNKTITWTSDNTSVATVNLSTGVVTGVAVGSATITATTEDGSFTATCDVTVENVVTFDATSDTGTSPLSKNGVSFSCSNGVLNNESEYRLYKNSTTTISVTSGKITKIEFIGTSDNPASGFGTQTGWSTSGDNGTWIGTAASVSFTASGAQVRATKIKVTVATTATPTFSVAGGEYSEAKNVELSCATDGATIYYTSDGTTPTSSSTAYSSAIDITTTTTLKAIAIKSGVESEVATATYTMNRPAAPTFDVEEGIFGEAFTLHLSAADGATIYYTTNGDTPTTSSTEYSDGVSISAATTTVKAIAVKSGLMSDVATATYTYDTRPAPEFTLSATVLDLKVNETSSAVTLTTNSDGAVTFSCEDAAVTLTGTGNSRTISADAAGTYTINVATAATSNYLAGAGMITVTVTKKATTMVLTPTFTSKDLYVTTSGSLTGAPQYNSSDIAGAEVTYSSSDETVATIAADGSVTFRKAGTTTLTASYAGNDEYAACEATYVLDLTDTTPQAAEVGITFGNALYGTSYSGTGAAGNGPFEGTVNNVTITVTQGSGDNLYVTNSETRIYGGTTKGTITIAAPTGYFITKIVFNDGTAPSKWDITATPGTLSTVTWTGKASSVVFSASSRSDFQSAVVTLAPTVTIGASGYASYCSPHKLDFTDSDVKAYKASVNSTTGQVTLSSVDVVPAEEGVILYCETSGTYAIPVTKEAASDVTGNQMVGVLTRTQVEWNPSTGVYNYILQQGNFNKATNGYLKANRAYLQTSYNVTAPGARALSIVFDDGETTGISSMHNSQCTMHNEYFDLQGRRVAQPAKGLYIVNGRKVVIK